MRAARALRRADPHLGRLIARVGACRMELQSQMSPFEALVRAICHQQLHGKAAQTIHARVHTAFSERGALRAEKILAAEEAQLRATGLSRQKSAAIRDLAARTSDGTVPPLEVIRLLPNEEIIARLTTVRGVGLWTAQMFLMFALGRPDVLPAGDYGVRKGFARAFRMKRFPTPLQVLERGRRWEPWRTVASWYLWRASEFPGRPIAAAKAGRKASRSAKPPKQQTAAKRAARAKRSAPGRRQKGTRKSRAAAPRKSGGR